MERGHLVNEPEAPLLTVSPTGSASGAVLISKQGSVRGSLLSGLGELVISSLVTEEYFILINHRVSQEILFFFRTLN